MDSAAIPGPTYLLLRAMERMLGRLLSIDHVNRLYQEVRESAAPETFIEAVLARLEMMVDIDGAGLAAVPRSGGVMVVANHPFGLADPLLMLHLLRNQRPDLKILGNQMLQQAPESEPYLIPVDPFESSRSAMRNLVPLRQAINWLADGHLLGMFPAGEVAALSMRRWGVREKAWNVNTGRILQRTQATALPIYFHGGNSAMFHLAGLLHPLLRTALLPKELLRKQRTRLRVTIGEPLPWEDMADMGNARELTGYLHFKTESLGSARRRPQGQAARIALRSHRLLPQPIGPAADPAAVEAEIAALPPENRLLATGEFQVWHARAAEIPTGLVEIGRLREITFRDVGEGSGKACDLDRFDRDYRHLLLWHEPSRRIAGAYRLGLLDEIVPRRGAQGLYLSTLFQIAPPFLRHVAPGVEVGRSFVARDFQRSYLPLLLLWKGIAQFLVQHPRYRYLFGPVSISSAYASVSKRLMAEYLLRHHGMPELAGCIRPRHAPRWQGTACLEHLPESARPTTMDALSAMIDEIEPHQDGVPILIKQYLKLGGRIAGFNVDPAFSHVLDALLVVDVARTDARTLSRYMGQEGARLYQAGHRGPDAAGRRAAS
jgi:putative hemolysin